MYPAGVSLTFPYQFVHAGQGLEEGKVFATFLHRWQIDVRRLATEVMAVRHATHCLVKFRTPIPAVYADGTEAVSQRLKHHVAQVSQVQYLLQRGAFILDAKSLGGVRASELAQTKIVG